MRYLPLCLLILLLIGSCGNNRQSTNATIYSFIVGKWLMVEYGGGSVNALDTLCFYKNGKADCPIKSDSLIIYNKGFGEQHFKILKLSNDSLIRQIRQQRIYADSIDELINGEIEKYIRVTKK